MMLTTRQRRISSAGASFIFIIILLLGCFIDFISHSQIYTLAENTESSEISFFNAAFKIAAASGPSRHNPSPAPDLITTGGVGTAVFRSVALPIKSLPAAAQWEPIYAVLEAPLNSECTSPDCLVRTAKLESAIAQARKSNLMDALRLVNLAVNNMITYASDNEIYGHLDHWASPSQTLELGMGDCEDFAILKMAALRALGIAETRLSLIVLRDLERDVFHAVLAVRTNQGHYILDNAHNAVVRDVDITRYQPLFSVSGKRYWLHGTPTQKGKAVSRNSFLFNIVPGREAQLALGEAKQPENPTAH